jgi:alanine-synthesizing transaminase
MRCGVDNTIIFLTDTMFDEIEFDRIKRLPKYVFAAVNELKMAERRAGEDVIDFSMGNPDGPTPQHIVDKLV